jgi:hypothetical protein
VSPADIVRGLSRDVAVIGDSSRSDPRAFEEAGATWWLETVHDQRGSLDEMLASVEAGPQHA